MFSLQQTLMPLKSMIFPSNLNQHSPVGYFTKNFIDFNENGTEMVLNKFVDSYLDSLRKSPSSSSNTNRFDLFNNLKIQLLKKDIVDLIRPLFYFNILHEWFKQQPLYIQPVESLGLAINCQNLSSPLPQRSYPDTPESSKFPKKISCPIIIHSDYDPSIKFNKLVKNKPEKRFKKKRKFNKDCLLKKVKSRVFKFIINKHMRELSNLLLTQKVYTFKNKPNFARIDDYFIKDVTLKRNTYWCFVSKTPLQLFCDYSPMKDSLTEFMQLKSLRREDYDAIIDQLDKTSYFYLFKPFRDVYERLIKDKSLYTFLIDKVKLDFEKKNKDENQKDYYSHLFKKTIETFIQYFEGRL